MTSTSEPYESLLLTSPTRDLSLKSYGSPPPITFGLVPVVFESGIRYNHTIFYSVKAQKYMCYKTVCVDDIYAENAAALDADPVK